ncbi:MAG TPA: NCS1 family nucleobase:cation symporter-1 [Gemmatimonadales bacterium]|jgi:NCS1 family nucleobase:cation symporter-1|nr:NCS1 family nucleobase:cation symporter-1 [Gemmatimonadales bacterium]
MTLPARTALANADLLPVAAEHRTWTWWHIASLWIGMAICIPTYTLASGLVDQGWTWQAAVGAVVLGNVVVLLPIALNSHAGTRYGIPFPVLARASFGVLGANVPALLRALVACGWFGIQTWIGGWAIYKLIEVLWPGIATLPQLLPGFVGLKTGEFICFMLFWAMNVWIVLRGMDSIKFLETWGSPFLLAVGVTLLVWAWVRAGGIGPMLQNPPAVGPSGRPAVGSVFGAGLTSAVAFWGTMALSIPDFSRYARSQRDQVIGQAVGLPGTMALFAFIGAAVTNATAVIFGTRIADPVALLARIGGPLMIILSMAGLTIATLTTNIAANIVAPANGFSNLAPHRISFKQGAMITAGVGILIMPWRLYNDAAAYIFTWLIGYGALLGPVAGIMIADYFALRRGVLSVDALYRRGADYEYRGGINWVAIAAFVLGVAPSLPGFIAALSGTPASGFFGGVYNWAWFVGFFVSAAVYLGGMKARG